MLNLHRFAAVLMFLLWAPGSRAAETPHWVHYRLLNGAAALPKKVVVIPTSVKVFEVTAGGVKEEVPDWSAQANKSMLKSLSAAISKAGGLQEVKMVPLSAADSAVVDEHMALYKLVVTTAPNSGLQHKLRRFDYGIGPGLAALLGKTGADAAVMVFGRDYAATTGRKTKAVLGKIPIVNIFTGEDADFGASYVHVGLVDLKTGDLLWMNSEYRDGSIDLRASEGSDSLVNSVFKFYPGIEEYRRVYAK
jgi:hypothetical protein